MTDQLLLWFGPLLAQEDAAPPELTPGQAIMFLMLAGVAMASMVMITVWMVRIGQSGHALPAARRGIHRVPVPLMAVAIAVSVLMLTMAAADSLVGRPLEPPLTPATEIPSDDGSGNSDDADDTGDTAEPASGPDEPLSAPDDPSAEPAAEPGADEDPDKLTPEQMLRTLSANLIFSLFLLCSLGIATISAQRKGRVSLDPRPDASGDSDPAQDIRIRQADWDSLLSAPATDLAVFTDQAGASSDTTTAADMPEPFSLTTELWYALEVFLAAWLPTALLRMAIVILSMGFSGAEPSQHPFLEMLNSGAGPAIIALIAVTAVILAPLGEELQYRVLIFGGLAQHGHPIIALIISSLLFAGAHGFPDSIALLPLAFALGYAYLRRRSYLTVVVVHLLFNAFNTAFALIGML